MTCSEIHHQLPAYLYGDLTDVERQAVHTHLADCTACQQECEALRQVRELLGTLPVPRVQLHPMQIQQEAFARHERKLRRWRRTAWVALAGLAAAVLLAVLPALEFRLEGHQLVLRWGTPPSIPTPAQPPGAVSPAMLAKLHDLEAHLRMLTTLVNVQAEEADLRDRQQAAELTALRTQLATLQLWVRAELAEIEKNLTAVFQLSRKGENR